MNVTQAALTRQQLCAALSITESLIAGPRLHRFPVPARALPVELRGLSNPTQRGAGRAVREIR